MPNSRASLLVQPAPFWRAWQWTNQCRPEASQLPCGFPWCNQNQCFSAASFSSCTLSNSACVASFFCCTLSKSALKAATSSSDRGIIPWLAVPAPRRCLSYILLRYSVPDGHRKSLCVPTNSQMCMSPLWPDFYTAQTPIPRCLHQADVSIYRVRMRQLRQREAERERKVDSRPFILTKRLHEDIS